MTEAKKNGDGDLLLGFAYQAEIDAPSHKTVAFQSHVLKTCTQEELDAMLDMCRKAVDRQRIFGEIAGFERDLANTNAQAQAAMEEMERKDIEYAKRAEEHPGRGERGLSVPEQNARKSSIAALENAATMRAILAERLEILKSRVEMGG